MLWVLARILELHRVRNLPEDPGRAASVQDIAVLA